MIPCGGGNTPPIHTPWTEGRREPFHTHTPPLSLLGNCLYQSPLPTPSPFPLGEKRVENKAVPALTETCAGCNNKPASAAARAPKETWGVNDTGHCHSGTHGHYREIMLSLLPHAAVTASTRLRVLGNPFLSTQAETPEHCAGGSWPKLWKPDTTWLHSKAWKVPISPPPKPSTGSRRL